MPNSRLNLFNIWFGLETIQLPQLRRLFGWVYRFLIPLGQLIEKFPCVVCLRLVGLDVNSIPFTGNARNVSRFT